MSLKLNIKSGVIFMVDFKNRLGSKVIKKKIHPCDLYEDLDRAVDKGPLRPAQDAVLKDWYDNYQHLKDVILKLHTGQGKTIIGLLMLQSRLNKDTGPSLYLCPNNYLVGQTCLEAGRFGIPFCMSPPKTDLPDEFIDGKSILIISAKKLFNGKSKFGLGRSSLKVSTILMDDSHACIDEISDACKITLKSNTNVYKELLILFGPELEKQGLGSFMDLKNGEYDVILPVPYWDWQNKKQEVAKILSDNKQLNEIKFNWPIIKNMLENCQCLFSGNSIEISPYYTPLSIFESFTEAEHRVFMSATLSDDSFLIKGLGLTKNIIENPLRYEKEKWSGEKMILIPSLIDESLSREKIINTFAKPNETRKFGSVVLAPRYQQKKVYIMILMI